MVAVSAGRSHLLGPGRCMILLVLVGVLYFPTLGTIPFYTKGEPREAVTAQQLDSGGLANWILPRRPAGSGLEVASKPPLFHWLVFLASRPRGEVTEAGARLPSALLGSIAVLATALVGASALGGRAGFYAGVVLTTNIEWLRAATTARVDMTVTALITLSLLLIYRGWAAGRISPLAYLGAGALMGAAVVAKGPIGIILPLGVLVTAMVAGGEVKLVRWSCLAGGLIVAGAIAGAWYAGAIWAGGEEFVHKQILKENLFRFISRSDTLGAGHKHPVYYYGPALAGGFAPWSLCLLPLGWWLLSARMEWRERRIVFLLSWFAFVFIFYSAAASKRSVYLLPLYPPLALLVGYWWSLLEGARRTASGRLTPLLRSLGYILCCVFLLPLVVLASERLGFSISELIRPFLHHKDQANLPLVRVLLMDNFAVAIGWGLLCGISAWFLGRAFAARKWRRSFVLLSLATAATLIMIEHIFQPPLAAKRTLKPFLSAVKEEARANNAFVCRFETTFDYSVEFYFGRPVPICPASIDPQSGEGKVPGRRVEPALVLLWDQQMRDLPEPLRARLKLLRTSKGTDPSGRRRLVLARWKGREG